MTIPIFLPFNNSYALPAAAALYSLLKNADAQHEYRLYVTAADITARNRKKLLKTIREFRNARLSFIDMDIELNDFWNSLTLKQHYSKEACYKLLMSKLFPQYQKIIITDVDVVFCGDVSKSFSTFDPADGCVFAGVRIFSLMSEDIDFYYSDTFSADEIELLKNGIFGGYLIANLDYIRKSHFEDIFLNTFLANAHRLVWADQDVINLTCAGKVAYLPLETLVTNMMDNFFSTPEGMAREKHYSPEEITYAMKHPIQRHFEGKVKPWTNDTVADYDLWLTYLRQTPYKMQYARILLKRRIREYAKRIVPFIKSCAFAVFGKERLKRFFGIHQ